MLIQAGEALPWIKSGSVPNSTKALAELCRSVGIPCAPVKSRDGEDAYDQWAATYGPKYPWVKAFTDYRVINKFIGTLETIKERLDAGGTLSYELLYFGAHTGRWSGAGGFNMQNMRKDPLYCDQDGRLITDVDALREIANSKTLPSFVAHVLDIRALFIARPGKKLIISDLSQIEPRCLAWMVNDTVMLGNLARGQGPYEAHARATMNWTGGEMKKENKELYALAKARVLGLGFGCGWKKFITVAQVMAGLDITKDDPEFVPMTNDEGQPVLERLADGSLVPKMESGYGFNSKRIVQEYRDSNPLITGLWRQLDDAFRASEGGDFTMTLPSGRQLRYPSVRRERKMVADPDFPGRLKARTQMTALAFDQKRNAVVRQPFYGGILTENAVQAFARDVFGEHCLALDRTSGVDVLFSVHDEAVNECDMNITKKDVEHIMSQCPEWCAGLPVAAEAVEASHYLK
jgi:DNA polymerase